MRHSISLIAAGLLVFAVTSQAQARGFGGFRAGGAGFGPYGGYRAGAARGGSFYGPRGTSVQAGRVGGVSRGPLGGVRAGGAEGVRVTTPGGRTYASGSRGGVGVGPYGGVRASGARGAAVSGPYGFAAGGYRGGVALGRGGLAVGHSTRYFSAASLRTTGGYVRTGYRGFGYTCFTPAWYRVHTAAWTTTRWRTANYWVAPAWGSLYGWCGCIDQPYTYDYGSNIIIENNTVYVAGDDRGSAETYAQGAIDLSDAGRAAKPADDAEWQPLGVFGMVQGDGDKVAQNIFQLAINKAGVLRGNYYDAVSDSSQPVYGSLDRKTQKLAWSIGEKKTVVFEAGLYNLTRPQTTILVHYGKERTEQMVLVRLEEGKDAKQ